MTSAYKVWCRVGSRTSSTQSTSAFEMAGGGGMVMVTVGRDRCEHYKKTAGGWKFKNSCYTTARRRKNHDEYL